MSLHYLFLSPVPFLFGFMYVHYKEIYNIRGYDEKYLLLLPYSEESSEAKITCLNVLYIFTTSKSMYSIRLYVFVSIL